MKNNTTIITNNPETIATTNTAKRTSAVILDELNTKIAEYEKEGYTGDTVPEDVKNLLKEMNVVKTKEVFRAWAETNEPLKTAFKELFVTVTSVGVNKTTGAFVVKQVDKTFDIRDFLKYLRNRPEFRDKIAHVPAGFEFKLENLAIAFDMTVADDLKTGHTAAEIADTHKRNKNNTAKAAEIAKMSKTQFKKTTTAIGRDLLPDIADILPADIAYIRDGYTKRTAALTVKGAGTTVFCKLFAEVLHKHATGSVYRFEFQKEKEKTPTNPTTPTANNLPNDNRTIGDIIEDAKNGTTPNAAPSQEPTTAPEQHNEQ